MGKFQVEVFRICGYHVEVLQIERLSGLCPADMVMQVPLAVLPGCEEEKAGGALLCKRAVAIEASPHLRGDAYMELLEVIACVVLKYQQDLNTRFSFLSLQYI